MKKAINFLWIVLVVASCISAFGQTGAGKIQGTVRDSQGAMIIGAKVHITQTGTSAAYDTTTNSAGIYSVPSLFVGDYQVQVESPGMASWEGNISLQVGQTAVIDVVLKPAAVTTQVTVAGDLTQLVTPDSPTQGTTLERERIEQIPMNGRSIAGVISLTSPGYQGGSSNQPRVNGLEWGAFSWVQDGASLDNRDGGGLSQMPPDPDSIQEVRIETSNSSAKFDRPGTAILSTRSGTNQIHGSAFETNRDNGYGVAKNRQDVTTIRAPKLIRNEYGASVGGPIFLPYLWHGRQMYNGLNKSFFFASFEKLAQRQAQSQNLYVPTDAMRSGNFAGVTNSAGQAITLYDPATTTPNANCTVLGSSVNNAYCRQPFPNNQIPMSRLSPLAKQLYAITPHPTNGNNPYAAPNWQGTTPNNTDHTSFTARLDHHFNENNLAFFRYTYGSQTTDQIGGSSGSYLGPPTTDSNANLTYIIVHTQGGALSWNHVFSPTFYNEFVASMNYESDVTQTGPNPNHDYSSDLGLQNEFGGLGYPYITGSTLYSQGSTTSTLMGYGQGNNAVKDNVYTNIFDDNLTLIRGNHNLQFGGRYRHERINVLPDQPYPARVGFSGLGTGLYNPSTGTSFGAVSNTGLATADFFMGNAYFYQNYLNESYLHMRNQEFAAYFQDDYRMLKNLTVNLGVRWEGLPALHERDNQFTAFDVANHAIVTGSPINVLLQKGLTVPQIVNGLQGIGVKFETTQQAGFPSSIVNSQYAIFAPRAGAAYKAFTGSRYSFITRGGFGRYLYTTPTRNFYGALNQQVPYEYNFQQDFTNASQAPDKLSNYILRSQQTVIAGQNSSDVINYGTNAVFNPAWGNITTTDPHFPLSYVDEWNVTLEKELPGRSAISVAYVGNHGANLEQYWNINPQPSAYVWYETTGTALPTGTYSSVLTRPYDKTTYGNIQIYRKTGFSNDNSLQINYQRLYNKGFAYQVSYVWSKAFRNGGNGFRDSTVYPASVFIPGTAPADDYKLNRYQNYGLDTAIAPVLLRWNWVLDIPVGRNKHFLTNMNRWADLLVGGWQLAGDGAMSRGLWQPSTGDWGPFTPLHYYGTKYKVKDCRSGATCYNAYLGYNGYLPPTQIGTTNGVQGLPSNYVPSHQPIIPIPANPAPPDANSGYFGTQTVFVTLANGTSVATPYSPGPAGVHPYSHVFLLGPMIWHTDASLFKVFPLTSTVNLKVDADFFNVFNQQGTNGPDPTTGIISTTSSAVTARIIQLTARVTW